MRRAALIVVVVLGSAIGCTDNPVSPSAVPVRADAFRNGSVYRPESGQPCAPYFYYSSCACWVPCVTLTLPMAAAVAAGAGSVSVNLTATDATGPGFLTVWPCGQVPPPPHRRSMRH